MKPGIKTWLAFQMRVMWKISSATRWGDSLPSDRRDFDGNDDSYLPLFSVSNHAHVFAALIAWQKIAEPLPNAPRHHVAGNAHCRQQAQREDQRGKRNGDQNDDDQG